MKDREEMMKQVQIADFELIEAKLYLDVYPHCEKALAFFYDTKEKSECARNEYEKKYGPLTAMSNTGNEWNWIDSPWPWECEG